MHPLKQTINREITNYGPVMNEIQYKRSLPHIKTVAIQSVDRIGIIILTSV